VIFRTRQRGSKYASQSQRSHRITGEVAQSNVLPYDARVAQACQSASGQWSVPGQPTSRWQLIRKIYLCYLGGVHGRPPLHRAIDPPFAQTSCSNTVTTRVLPRETTPFISPCLPCTINSSSNVVQFSNWQ
jgi:hypothetical protein